MNKKAKEYQQMSRKERRIAIAKDVIKWLDKGLLRPKSKYGYISAGSEAANLVGHSEGVIPAEKVKKAAASCEVCAKGGMLLARIGEYNNLTSNFIMGHGWRWSVDNKACVKGLSDAFSESQLDEIEMAFEKDYVEWEGIRSDYDRLRCIMQNIIDHDGTFKPKVAYHVV